MKPLFTFLVSLFILGNAICQYTWTPMDSPNKESFFVFHCTDTHFFGIDLRSNIYVSTDELATWTQIASETSITTRFTWNIIGEVVQEDKDGNFYFFNRNIIYKYSPSDNIFTEFAKDTEISSYSNIRTLDNEYILVMGGDGIELLDELGNSKKYREISYVNHVEVDDDFIYLQIFDSNITSSIEILDHNFITKESIPVDFNLDISTEGFAISNNRLLFDEGVYLDISSKNWGSINLPQYFRPDRLLVSGDTIIYTDRDYYYSLDGGQTFTEGSWDGLVTSATARYYAGLHKGSVFKSNTFCFYGGDEVVFMDLDNENISLVNIEYGSPFAYSIKAGTAENIIMYECDNDEDVFIKSDAVSNWTEVDDSSFSGSQFIRVPYDIDEWSFLPNGDIMVNYGELFRSQDNGRTWETVDDLPQGGEFSIKGDNIYYYTGNTIYHSLYDGEDWTELYTIDFSGVPFYGQDISINGYYYQTTTVSQGNEWQDYILRQNLNTGLVDSIEFDHYLGREIITSNYSNEIHFISSPSIRDTIYYNRSYDNGLTYTQTDISDLVGFSNIYWDVSIALDKADNLILTVEDKIYVSIDQGNSWIDITPTNPEIYTINGYTVGLDNQMYASTNGAGVIKADFIFQGLDRKPMKIVTFLDENSNCIKDNGEENISGIRINIDDTYFSRSNKEGEVFYNIIEGNHYVKPVIDSDLYTSCQAIYDFDISEDDTTTVVIPLEIINYCAKIESSLATPFLRRCFDNRYRGRISNVGTEITENLTATVQLDPFFEFESVDLNIISFDNNTLELEAGDLAPNESLDFFINFKVSCDAELGQEHCIALNVVTDNECNENPLRSPPQNCEENIGSYDPNDKAIIVNGNKNAQNYDFEDKIEYLIRCQNTGSDTAFNITILDTISDKFKIESIRPLVASHDYKWFVDRGVLNVTFYDILLVDSTTNEALSHAFIKFEIEISEDLNYGDVLTNQAAIYFDFNEPIFTNTTMTEINNGTYVLQESGSLDVFIYPNPVDGIITLNLKDPESSLSKVHIYNLNGQLILKENIGQSLNRHDLDISHLNSEVYIIQITGDNGNTWKSKFVKVE